MNNRRIRRAVTLTAICVSLLGAGCGGGSQQPTVGDGESTGSGSGMQSGQQGGGEGKVTISGFAYDPAVLTVKAGTEVSWSNSDDILHTVTAGTNEAPEAENFDGQLDGKGTTFKKVFEEAGTFQYFCTKHKLAMKGEVKVT